MKEYEINEIIVGASKLDFMTIVGNSYGPEIQINMDNNLVLYRDLEFNSGEDWTLVSCKENSSIIRYLKGKIKFDEIEGVYYSCHRVYDNYNELVDMVECNQDDLNNLPYEYTKLGFDFYEEYKE